MQRKTATLLAAITVLAAVSLPASAATLATARTSLNIRTGPGPEYPVIGAIPDRGQATVTGCIAGSLWCQVTYNGKQGWAYSQYMTASAGGQAVVVSQTVPALTFDAPATTVGATTTVVTPSIQGEFVAPAPNAPLAIAPPPATVQTYVTQNPVTPVYINGEVVQGVGLPEDVVLTPVPNYDYSYAYVNGVPVLVEPGTRRVTYIYR